MDIDQVKQTTLYKTLAKAVRKQDHEELARMLSLVPARAGRDFRTPLVGYAFSWYLTPQGDEYWRELAHRLEFAGHRVW